MGRVFDNRNEVSDMSRVRVVTQFSTQVKESEFVFVLLKILHSANEDR